jgi:excisionase family DNA binding protein
MKKQSSSVNVVAGFYNLKEAAKIAKCSDQTIKRMIKAGKLKAFQPTGPRGTVVIPQGNLVEFLTSRAYGEK